MSSFRYFSFFCYYCYSSLDHLALTTKSLILLLCDLCVCVLVCFAWFYEDIFTFNLLELYIGFHFMVKYIEIMNLYTSSVKLIRFWNSSIIDIYLKLLNSMSRWGSLLSSLLMEWYYRFDTYRPFSSVFIVRFFIYWM